MRFDDFFGRFVLRLGRIVGKEHSLKLAWGVANASRKLATFAHRQVFRLLWELTPQTEWQDHYTSLHVLWGSMRQPFWIERGCVSALALKEAAEMLSICCGDGFYDYYFYSGRAKHITAVDFDPSAIAYARKYNQASNISYEICDIRLAIPKGAYDNIVWNGAIEHFTPEEISQIMQTLRNRLKPGGILSGYTIAALPGKDKQLSHHEYEFTSKEDLLRFFTPYFPNVKVFETIWPAVGTHGAAHRHNLYFYASDAVLPFDSQWPHVVTSSSFEADKKEEAGRRASTEMLPISEFAEDDIFIVGYPKSGNTWFQYLIAGLVYGINAEQTPDTLVQDLVPDIHSKQDFKRYSTPMFFKSHDLPKREYKRVVYLLRDGRDAMVSYYHHTQALAQNEQIDFLEMVRDGKHLFPCKWHEHVQRWSLNPYRAKIITVKYEDLKNDPVNELRKFCEFAGLKRDDSILESVVNRANFNSMRQREIRHGWDDPSWPKDKPFIRRGKVGSYQDEMPEGVLKCFLNEAAKTLNDHGYAFE